MMKDQKLKLEEIKKRFILAKYYQKAVHLLTEKKFFRQAADVSYNAAELCAKAFILLKQDTLPKKHVGVVQIFSLLYVKTEEVDKEIGRRFRKSLEIRNNSRYVSEVEIDKETAQEVANLTNDLIKLLGERLRK